jgi:hypothetical protein
MPPPRSPETPGGRAGLTRPGPPATDDYPEVTVRVTFSVVVPTV